MNESGITTSHYQRAAVVYVRQSTPGQVERNRESTARQYDLVDRAVGLGWSPALVRVIDDDLGHSGASTVGRTGFADLASQVGLGQVGIVLALECSRLARNNADWYRLLDLAGMTDTLIGDTDGVYHPGLFNDRLVLGMKGTMSEAELHILRARLNGGIRNKAARGELRRGLPVGLVWGDDDGEIRLHPDEAVTGVIHAIFERFPLVGSVRGVWLWLREHCLAFPLQSGGYVTGNGGDIVWVEPTYHAVHTVLTHPAYAGAYVYGRTRQQRYLGDNGELRTRRHKVAQDQWEVLITGHHPGYIDWDTYQMNQERIRGNIRPVAHAPGTGAVREGAALLQGLATCGHCARRLAVYYTGPTKSTPGYYCKGAGTIVDGRGLRHLHVGGTAIDHAVTDAFLAAIQPTALQACLTAAQHIENNHDTVLTQWRRHVEHAQYQASKAEHRYRAVDPDNRLVARSLETEWEHALTNLANTQTELTRREAAHPTTLTPQQKTMILTLADNLTHVWSAPTTTDKDRKQLLRALLEEVNITVHRDTTNAHADLILRWKGGAITNLTIPLKRKPPVTRTKEDTIHLIRRLAVHYPDPIIAGILNRQHRTTAQGLEFTANRVQSLRHHHNINCHQPNENPDTTTEIVTITQAATILGVAPSTLHRWLNDGFIAGEQITPGAPWRIRLTEELKNLFVDNTPPGWVVMQDATTILGVTRQTIMQRVKNGQLQAIHVRTGRRKGLRIHIPDTPNTLF